MIVAPTSAGAAGALQSTIKAATASAFRVRASGSRCLVCRPLGKASPMDVTCKLPAPEADTGQGGREPLRPGVVVERADVFGRLCAQPAAKLAIAGQPAQRRRQRVRVARWHDQAVGPVAHEATRRGSDGVARYDRKS